MPGRQGELSGITSDGAGTSPDDAALIAAWLAEPARFGEVFDRHADEIYRYVARRLGAETAADLVSDVFLIAFRNRAAFDPERAEVRAWLAVPPKQPDNDYLPAGTVTDFTVYVSIGVVNSGTATNPPQAASS